MVTKPVIAQLKEGRQGGGLTLRTPPDVGVHLESVASRIALTADVPDFFDANADVTLDWTLSGQGPAWNDPPDADAQIVCSVAVARTKVDPGTLGSVLLWAVRMPPRPQSRASPTDTSVSSSGLTSRKASPSNSSASPRITGPGEVGSSTTSTSPPTR